MAYTPWSVVYGEQPSATKWNILGQNDASFADGSGIAPLSTAGGWRDITDTFTYSSVSGLRGTVTVPSDATTQYAVGDWISFVQTTRKYFQIVAVTSTTLVLTGGTDFTLTNAAISDILHSKWRQPVGAPSDFAMSANIRFFISGKNMHARGWGSVLGTGANAASLTVSLALPFLNQTYDVVANCYGFKATAPATRVDVTGSAANTLMTTSSLATGSFAMWALRTDTNTFNDYRVFGFQAVGPISA